MTYPSRGVADTEVQNLALRNEVVERLHQLRNTRSKVPSMHVVDIDVISAQVLQALGNGKVHALGTSAAEVALLDRLSGLGAQRVLCRDDHLIATARGLEPLADELLALAALVRIGGVDEVTAEVVVGVEQLEGIFLCALSHHGTPCSAQACAVSVMLSKIKERLDVLMPPSEMGLTRMDADGANRRCLPSRDFGGAGLGGILDCVKEVWNVGFGL